MSNNLVTKNSGIELGNETLPRLRKISTATTTLILLKLGIRACFIDGARPIKPDGCHFVAEAFTLRFIPMREDLSHPDVLADPDYALSRDNMFREEWIPKIKSGGYTNFRLYNLRRDPGQTTDISSIHPDRLSRMKSQLLEINATCTICGEGTKEDDRCV